jgi:hypothetical protein
MPLPSCPRWSALAARPLRVVAGAVLAAAAACAPRARPLAGLPAPDRALPPPELPATHHLVTFTWRFRDDDLSANGEGAARISPPDSVRLDLVLKGGFAGATAAVVGDEVRTRLPIATRILPPTPLFWAAMGRLAVPPGDTAVVVDGDTLRAEIAGASGQWRAAWVRGRLSRLEQVAGGRIVARLERRPDGTVVFDQPGMRRRLDLAIVRRAEMPPFDPALWILED